MTFMEVKGHQRSNVANCDMATIFGQKNYWCKLRMMMTLTEVNCGKLCAMSTIFCQKNHWCKLRLMMTFTEVKGHQRSNVVCAMATIFGQKSCWCKFRMMMTFMEVKGQQRSNIVNYATWLSNLVRSTADASLGWWGPSWRSKVNRGQIL